VLDRAWEGLYPGCSRCAGAHYAAARSFIRSDHFRIAGETAAAPHLSIAALVTNVNKKILVADVPELDARLVSLLSDHKLFFVRTLDEAIRALEHEEFDLLIISVHFDDSRMFDLLRQARLKGRNKGIPIICVREPGLGFTAISSNTLEVTCRALDANAFVDLANLKDEDERNAALRHAVAELLKDV
jgi:CheY-like chemotaxis protein